MTTVAEAKALPKAYAAIKKYGARAQFTIYGSVVVDTDESTVDQSSPVVHEVYVTPPEPLQEKYADDGSLIENAGLSFYVGTGALTSEPISFTPDLGQKVSFRSRDYVVRAVEPVVSGDHVPFYRVEARA